MKNKITVLILIIICFGINIKIINAAECETLTSVVTPGADFREMSRIYVHYGTNIYEHTIYKLKDEESGNSFVAYCRNPGVSATSEGSVDPTVNMSCLRTVFDATEKVNTKYEVAELSYEKGIVKILQNGYKLNVSDDIDYIITNSALRIYEMLWLAFDTNDSSSRKLFTVFQYYVNKFLDDGDIKPKLDEIDALLESDIYTRKNKYLEPASQAIWSTDPSFQDSSKLKTSEVDSKIRQMILDALNASIDYLNNGSASITHTGPIKNRNVRTINGKRTYTFKHTYDFKLEKFDSSNSSVKMAFECPDCDLYDIDYKITLRNPDTNREYNFTETTELKNLVTNGTGNLQFIIDFTTDSSLYNGENVNYHINLKFKDDTISTEAYVMRDVNCTYCQRFYMLYAEDVEKTKTISNFIGLPPIPADRCKPYLENAECNKENSDNEIVISEGFKIEEGNTCSNISEENNLNVLDCIINNTDASGNSYQDTDLLNNSYCSVWCKEDYRFNMPGMKNTEQGRYFTLETDVHGRKTCYMSKTVGTDNFKNALNEQRKKVIDAYNIWAKYDAIEKARDNWVQVGVVGNKYNNYKKVQTECPEPEPNDGILRPVQPDETCYACQFDSESSCYTTQYKISTTYGQYTSTGGYNTNLFEETFGSAYGQNGKQTLPCGSGRCSKTTAENDYKEFIENEFGGSLEEIKGKLDAEIKKYQRMINSYNQCNGEKVIQYNSSIQEQNNVPGWKMDYTYNPTITFWYAESYMNSAISNEMETYEGVTKARLEEKSYSQDDGKNPTNEIFDTYETITHFVCYNDGTTFKCGPKTLKIGISKYVTQTMTVDASYITPTQFYTIYPNGGIVSAEPGKEDEIENSSELPNALPIGLGTTDGTYNYLLKVKNLGEYYQEARKFGRIWGRDNSAVVIALEDAELGVNCSETGALVEGTEMGGKKFNDGIYVCKYTVDCPEGECPPEIDTRDCDPNDPSSPGFKSNWQELGWTDGCTPCPDCPPEIIVNPDPTDVDYRPITPDDINPNDREPGVNWKYDENSITTGLELKAYTTTTEIVSDSESIYENNSGSNNDFKMTITLNARTLNKIREYSQNHQDTGGYATNTLKCYDHIGIDGETYKNIYCYSTFIDELIYNDPNSVEVENRIIGTDAESTHNLRKGNQTQTSGYWTPWDEASWTITTAYSVNYYKTNYKEIGIGPSWK